MMNVEKYNDIEGFYNNSPSMVWWVYYNPDATSGGQIVGIQILKEDILKAAESDNFEEYLAGNASRRRNWWWSISLLDNDVYDLDSICEHLKSRTKYTKEQIIAKLKEEAASCSI